MTRRSSGPAPTRTIGPAQFPRRDGGEAILRMSLAKAAIDRMAAGSTPARAGRSALARLARVHGHAGLILVDRPGRASAVFNTPRMVRGLASEKDGLRIGIDKKLRRPRPYL